MKQARIAIKCVHMGVCDKSLQCWKETQTLKQTKDCYKMCGYGQRACTCEQIHLNEKVAHNQNKTACPGLGAADRKLQLLTNRVRSPFPMFQG